MLSVVTVRVLIPAHAALDTMEMEHHAPVNHIIIIIFIIIIIIYYYYYIFFIIISILIDSRSRDDLPAWRLSNSAPQ